MPSRTSPAGGNCEAATHTPLPASAPASGRCAHIRFAAWILLALAIPAGTLAWLWCLRGQRILHNDSILIGGWIVLSTLILCVAMLLKTTPRNAIRLGAGSSLIVVLGVTILLHAAALVLLRPALSEDLARYRLDGRMWLAKRSPYATTPRQFAATHPTDAIDAAVTHPELNTIYLPTSQALFVVAAGIEQWIGIDPGPDRRQTWREMLDGPVPPYRGIVFRAAAAIAAVVSTLLLIAILNAAGQSIWCSVLFAWHPLVILECAGSGHQDIVGVMLLLLVVRSIHRASFTAASLWLGLATGIKPFAVLLLPFVLRDAYRDGRLRQLAICCVAFVVCVLMLFAPLMLIDGGYVGWSRSARLFSRAWEANGSIYELIKYLFGEGDDGMNMERAKQGARLLAGMVTLLVTATLWIRRSDVARAGYWVLLTSLLFAPVVYPWYLIWMLGFVPLLAGAGGVGGLVFAATVSISYVLWHLPQWVMPARLLLVEYPPVYAALLAEVAGGSFVFRSRRKRLPTP
ncbi:glycosyltransferase 87 family protein [Fontivita pretiosa]|uniref:glycosyltransferase 87 family protein n=1 Tax=Fontivita pretiosa TaxID=2989684 RepID=UPI003D17C77D